MPVFIYQWYDMFHMIRLLLVELVVYITQLHDDALYRELYGGLLYRLSTTQDFTYLSVFLVGIYNQRFLYPISIHHFLDILYDSIRIRILINQYQYHWWIDQKKLRYNSYNSSQQSFEQITEFLVVVPE